MIDEIIKQYEQGKTKYEIAEDTGISRRNICLLLKYSKKKDWMLDQLRSGKRQVDIAREMGVSRQAISYVLMQYRSEIPTVECDICRKAFVAKNLQTRCSVCYSVYGNEPAKYRWAERKEEWPREIKQEKSLDVQSVGNLHARRTYLRRR